VPCDGADRDVLAAWAAAYGGVSAAVQDSHIARSDSQPPGLTYPRVVGREGVQTLPVPAWA